MPHPWHVAGLLQTSSWLLPIYNHDTACHAWPVQTVLHHRARTPNHSPASLYDIHQAGRDSSSADLHL